MTRNRASAKKAGTEAETAVVAYLKANGWEWAERRAKNGNKDRGDIQGIPGVVIEVKNVAKLDLAGWVKEAETERANDGAWIGVVWHKRRGKSDPADWYVTMTGATFTELIREAL